MVMKPLSKVSLTGLVVGVLAGQPVSPVSATAPSAASGQLMRSVVSVQGLEYGPFVRGCVSYEVCDKAATYAGDLLLGSEAIGTLWSDDIPALNGGSLSVRQAFQLMTDSQSFTDIIDGTSNTVIGRTAGVATLTFQDGQDLILGFTGRFRTTVGDLDGDGLIDLEMRVDAYGSQSARMIFDDTSGSEKLRSLVLELAGHIDLGSREVTALGGHGTLQIDGSGFGG